MSKNNQRPYHPYQQSLNPSHHMTENVVELQNYFYLPPTSVNTNFQIRLGLGINDLTLEQLRSQYDDFERANRFHSSQYMFQVQQHLDVEPSPQLLAVNGDELQKDFGRMPTAMCTTSKKNDKNNTRDEEEHHDLHRSTKKRNVESGCSITKINAAKSKKRSPESQQLQQQKQKQQKNDDKWLTAYEELIQFQQLTGHTVVPRGYALNTKLASWVSEQRKQYRLFINNQKSSIVQQRIQLLNDLNFVWNAQAGAWDRQLEQLQQYHAKHGHCNVPIHRKKYIKLNLWVSEQRRQYSLLQNNKESRLTPERLQRLSALDFCFSTHEERWRQRLVELKKFKLDNGHCNVTSSNSQTRLSDWAHHQRGQYKKLMSGKSSYLTTKRVEELNEIGFIWSRNQVSTTDDNFECQSESESHEANQSIESYESDDIESDFDRAGEN